MKYLLTITLLLPSIALTQQRSCGPNLYELEADPSYVHDKYSPSPVERYYDGKAFVASIDGDDDDRFHVGPEWVSAHIKRYEDGDEWVCAWI